MMSNVGMKKEKPLMEAGRPYAGESPGERVLRRRQQFLAAGLELFGTVGYRMTTVRALCRQAELTDRYFYESFTGTEDLLVAVYQSCLEGMQRGLLTAIAGAEPGLGASELVRVGLDAFFVSVENPRVARVVWLEILGVSPRVDQVYNAAVRGFADIVLSLTRTRYPKLALSDEEGQILAIAMIGAVSQSTLNWLLSDYQASRATMVSANSHIFMGVINGLEQRGS